jgi:hypothetical protein
MIILKGKPITKKNNGAGHANACTSRAAYTVNEALFPVEIEDMEA